jgi:hypothetical protein
MYARQIGRLRRRFRRRFWNTTTSVWFVAERLTRDLSAPAGEKHWIDESEYSKREHELRAGLRKAIA